MKITIPRLLRITAAAAALLAAADARAVLKDHGPADPVLTWPLWYRDLNGTALGLCRSTSASPNPAAGGAPMCFPLAADPAGFAGNVGAEVFYANATVLLASGGFSLRYVAALEATYVPGPAPVRGQETVFARIRVVMQTAVPGTYTVTHPYGVEVFPDVGTGPRAVFFTADVPLGVAGNFDLALGGRVGPFLQWDFVNPGETLTLPSGEQFIGDPNYLHGFTGSPFGTNYVRIDGPPGSNLDGAGNDFVVTTQAAILGQRWTAPIALPLSVDKAIYSRDLATGLNTVDVWASSSPGAQLLLTGQDMPTIALRGDGAGKYYGHVEYPASLAPPSAVSVTNTSSNPIVTVSAGLTDQLNVQSASWNPATGAYSVTAQTSDRATGASALLVEVLGPGGGPMAEGPTPGSRVFAGILPVGSLPPVTVALQSSGGGVARDELSIGSGAPMNPPGPPTASPDAFSVAGSGPSTFDVSANDSFAGTFQVILLSQPTQGTAVAAASGGNVTFTPRAGAVSPDGFSYVLRDVTGAYSNVATVNLSWAFVAPAPAAGADNNAMVQNTAKAIAVLANDTAAPGTSLDPASVLVSTAPARGTATPNPDGTVTYRPSAGFVGTDTFAYTVANTAGSRSAPATVTIVVFGGAESVSMKTTQWTAASQRWTLVGGTNWFAAALTQATATCYAGTTVAGPVIGSAPVDTTGKFQIVPVASPPVPANPSSVTCQTSYGGRVTASVVFK